MGTYRPTDVSTQCYSLSCLQDCDLCPDILSPGLAWAARRTYLIFDWSTKFVVPQIYKRVNDRQGTFILELYHSQMIIGVASVHILILPTRFYSDNNVL